MPVGYVIDRGLGLVVSRAWGRLTDHMVRRHAAALRMDHDFRPDLNQLIDFRGVTEFALSAEGIRGFARDVPFGPGAHRAIVVASDVAFGLARMYQLLTAEHSTTVQVFGDLERALDWLGLATQASTANALLEFIVALPGTE